MIDFSNNLNCFKPNKKVFDLINKNRDIYLGYPKSDQEENVSVLSKYLNIPESGISWTNGATQALFLLPQILKSRKTLIVGPTFWEYSVANKRCSSNNILIYTCLEADKFQIDWEKLNNKLTGRDTCYICNPNNPTSTIYSKNKLIKLIKLHPEVQFVIDETYMIFRYDYSSRTLTKMSTKLNNLYVVTSLSKFFALPGLRMGFITSNSPNIKKYNDNLIPYSSNPVIGILLPILLKDKKFITQTRNYYKSEGKRFYNYLNKLSGGHFHFYMPNANFVFAKILKENLTSTKLVKKIASKGFLLRDASIYEGLNDKYIRFSIRNESENNKLAKILSSE